MDNKITGILSSEHQTVLKKLDKFETALQEKDLKTINEIINFFENKLILHRRKEEEYLFKELEKYEEIQAGPITCMLEEHKEEKELVSKLKNLIRTNPVKNTVEIQKTGLEIIHFLRNHIWKEDNVLFPLAEKTLSDEEKKRISVGFDSIGTCCEECCHNSKTQRRSS
ncbi:MAG: hemerythrin domain-containing protein [Planctomycetes bacterium]|nr:hemerythrin domain-containing protein [Planctomycetota bacterium]